MPKNNFLIYGSYGYTGKLIAELACKQGLHPVLAGRNKDKLAEQAKQLNLNYRVFDLSNMDTTKKMIGEFVAVIHCAGPFIRTFKNMAKACIATQTHYIDITGEIAVIEGLTMLGKRASAANVMLLPGAGFDVVPTDCLAQHLKSRLPDACELTLAIAAVSKSGGRIGGGMPVSRGTAKTMLNGAAIGTLIRDGGELKIAPAAVRDKTFIFSDGMKITCMPLSWGDLASAWQSTHIPHIETYMAASKKSIRMLKLIKPLRFLFKFEWVRKIAENRINRMPEGPSPEMREQTCSTIFGEVKNPKGEQAVSLLKGPEGYDLTALTAITIIKKILAGNAPAGFQTPSTAYGKDLILEIDGVTRQDVA